MWPLMWVIARKRVLCRTKSSIGPLRYVLDTSRKLWVVLQACSTGSSTAGTVQQVSSLAGGKPGFPAAACNCRAAFTGATHCIPGAALNFCQSFHPMESSTGPAKRATSGSPSANAEPAAAAAVPDDDALNLHRVTHKDGLPVWCANSESDAVPACLSPTLL